MRSELESQYSICGLKDIIGRLFQQFFGLKVIVEVQTVRYLVLKVHIVQRILSGVDTMLK
jgi:hypothetical protein